jgi:hypothetical protein
MKSKLVLIAATLTLLTLSRPNAQVGGVSVTSESHREVTQVDGELQKNSQEVAVDGDYLKAFTVAFEAFNSDALIPEQKRSLENYTIIFSRDKNCIYVFFYAKRLESERGLKGGETPRGRDVKYCISRKSYKVLDRIFFK